MNDARAKNFRESLDVSQKEFIAQFLIKKYGPLNGKNRVSAKIRAARLELATREYKRRFGIDHQNEKPGIMSPHVHSSQEKDSTSVAEMESFEAGLANPTSCDEEMNTQSNRNLCQGISAGISTAATTDPESISEKFSSRTKMSAIQESYSIVMSKESDKHTPLKSPGSNLTIQTNSIAVTGVGSFAMSIPSPNVDISSEAQAFPVTPLELSDGKHVVPAKSRENETSTFNKESDKWIEDLEKLKKEYTEPLSWSLSSETVAQAIEIHKRHISKFDALRNTAGKAMAEISIPSLIMKKFEKEAQLLDYWMNAKFVNLERFQEFLRSVEHEIKWTKDRKRTEIERDWSKVRAGDIAGLDLFYATIGADWKHHRSTIQHLLHTHPIQQQTSHPGYAVVKSLSRNLRNEWNSCLTFIRCGKAQWEDAKVRRLTCRASPLTRALNVTVIGDLTTGGISFKQFQQVSLIEKISTSIWKVKNEDGNEARLPSVLIQIPPRPKRTTDSAQSAPPPKRRRL